MTVDQLLKELETLTHNGRMARMAEIGRLSKSDADLASLLDELEQGGSYQRRLALQSCYGSSNGERVLRGLSDVSRLARNLALHLVPLTCDDDQILAVLRTLAFQPRRAMMRQLAKLRHYAPVNGFLEETVVNGDTESSSLIVFASSDAVRQLWPQVSERAALTDWFRLARRHPQVALEFLRADIAQLPTDSDLPLTVLSRANSVLHGLVQPQPHLALGLFNELMRGASPNRLQWQFVLERLPREVTALLLESEADTQGVEQALSSVLHRLDESLLLKAIVRWPKLLQMVGTWLRRLAPPLRARVYEANGLGWRDGSNLIAPGIVGLLPRTAREAEARRHWNLPLLLTRPEQRLSYAVLLSWDEAREAIRPYLNNPEPPLRIAALRAICGTARYFRDRVSEVLEIVRQRGNEQDPVRLAMIGALAALPPIVWQEENLETLSLIIRQALDAADLSPSTAQQAEGLILRALPRHPEWAIGWLATLVKERGYVSLRQLESLLNDDEMIRLAPVLEPVLRSWLVREREHQFISAVRALGKRAQVFPHLDELIEIMVRNGQQSNARSALDILQEHFRIRFAAFVPELLQQDPSWATQRVVYEFLHRKRQDLITDFLGRSAYKGKFSTGRTRFVLPLQNGFERWLPEQQELFAETLTEVVNDNDCDTPAKLYAVAPMAALPDFTPPVLWQVARRQSEQNLALRDAALRALARLDAGQGVSELIAGLADERARIAIYALRGALLEMPVSRAVEILRAAPTEKVTVAKEIVRLLGDLKSAEALEALLEWAPRELHRDVHVALLRALWQHLEDERVWLVLEKSAQSEDAAIATMLARTTAPRLSRVAQERLANLLASLMRHADAKVRLNVLQRCELQPVADARHVLREPLFAALDSNLPDEYQTAARAVFASYPREGNLIADAVRRLVPRRRALSETLPLLLNALKQNNRFRSAMRAVVEVLGEDAVCAPWRVRVAIHTLSASEILALLEELVQSNDLHAETLQAACQEIAPAIPSVPDMWEDFFESMFEGEVRLRQPEKLEELLSSHHDDRLRRVALSSLIAASRDSAGWTLERRVRLVRYQSDASPLVASAAEFTFAPEESSTELEGGI